MSSGSRGPIELDRIALGDRVCDFMVEEIAIALLIPAGAEAWPGRRMTRTEWRRLIETSRKTDEDAGRQADTLIAA
jgi:hypothetical protein